MNRARYRPGYLSQGYELLYQDDTLVVVDKKPGLLTVPGRLPENKFSLQSQLLERFANSRIVHRLDQPTSGLVVVPQSQSALSHLSKQFQQRTVKKRYQAVVQGLITDDTGTIDQPLICDWPNRPRQMVHRDGKPSQTLFRVLERNLKTGCSRVALYPITGRSHQLRVHLQFIGHPILGDNLYGDRPGTQRSADLLLHAEQISFIHPVSGVQLTFTCPAHHWPQEL